MKLVNTKNSYGFITIFLHWLMAILMIGLLILGIYMVNQPISLTKLKLYGWHKEWGMLALLLFFVRLIWRLANQTPALPATLPAWQKIAAYGAHFSFYFLMLFIPLAGWFLTSTAGLPVSFFGLFVLPDLISPNESQRFIFTFIHKWLSYGLIALIFVHITAALKHHFINRDDILKRIIRP